MGSDLPRYPLTSRPSEWVSTGSGIQWGPVLEGREKYGDIWGCLHRFGSSGYAPVGLGFELVVSGGMEWCKD